MAVVPACLSVDWFCVLFCYMCNEIPNRECKHIAKWQWFVLVGFGVCSVEILNVWFREKLFTDVPFLHVFFKSLTSFGFWDVYLTDTDESDVSSIIFCILPNPNAPKIGSYTCSKSTVKRFYGHVDGPQVQMKKKKPNYINGCCLFIYQISLLMHNEYPCLIAYCLACIAKLHVHVLSKLLPFLWGSL